MLWKCSVAAFAAGMGAVTSVCAQDALPSNTPEPPASPPPTTPSPAPSRETPGPDLATLFADGGALAPGQTQRRPISTAQPLETMGSGSRGGDNDRSYVTAIFNPGLAFLGKWSARLEVAPLAAHALFVEGSILHLTVPGYSAITINGQAVEFGYHLYPFGNGVRGLYLGPRLFFASGNADDYVQGNAWGYGFDLGYQLVIRPIALNFGLGVGYAKVNLKATDTLLQALAILPEYEQVARDITLTVSSVIPVLTLGIGFGY